MDEGKEPIQVLGRYELYHLLAPGRIGGVYLGKLSGAAGFEKNCVIKTIHPALTQDPEFLDRFQHEAKLLTHLVHSNIGQVYELGHEGDTWFTVLEYVAGVDLWQLLSQARAQGRPLPVPLALYIGQKMALAIAYAHRRTGSDGELL